MGEDTFGHLWHVFGPTAGILRKTACAHHTALERFHPAAIGADRTRAVLPHRSLFLQRTIELVV